ncbi:hypothetical protein [Alistipes putredinis]|uniref:hypothetical protein n=1 Tax=Alistipes putredinis TaxID=28117 RepID=UPI00242C603E|nr:hypothetical protein [Alistipes putredinis]
MMIDQISRRLHEVNALLATRVQGGLSFEQALPPSLFYRDFSDTNRIIGETEALAKKDAEQLMNFSSSLLSEIETYLSLDRTLLQAADFEALFEEHLKPFELRYEEAKVIATKLWGEYSAMSNRLDFLPLDSEEYRSLDAECGAVKAKYDGAHAHANLLYKEWVQERDRNFCVWCFKPMFLDVLVERLQGIAGSIISDIRRMKEGEP